MSLDFGDTKADPSTRGTMAATLVALIGFPIVFFACGLLVLAFLAILIATLGPAAPGGSPQEILASGGLFMGLGIAAANFAVALIVLFTVTKLFAVAKPRLTNLGFATGYAVLACLIALMTDLNLVWSVTGVAAACLFRTLRLPASEAN